MELFDGIIFGLIDNGVLLAGALFGLGIESKLPKYFHNGIGAVFGAGIGNAFSDMLGGLPIDLGFAFGTFVGCIIALAFVPLILKYKGN